MGGKKKGGGDAGAAEEDTSTKEFLQHYKKNCSVMETPVYKPLEKRINELLEEGEIKLPEILVNEKIGEAGARAIANALRTSNKGKGYAHCQAIRIWDGEIGNEGVRAFYQFLADSNNTSVKLIEFLNCSIEALGCEFIARIFDPTGVNALEILTLDYNKFGNEGFYQLINGLKFAKSLTYLSLAYCDIDENGIKFIGDYISNEACPLEKLNIQGNPLKNAGLNTLIQALIPNTILEELNINNILFGKDETTITNLSGLMQSNTNIKAYQLKFNLIDDKDFAQLLETLKADTTKHIWQFVVDEKLDKDLFETYFKVMKGKPKPKKKEKGKKKK